MNLLKMPDHNCLVYSTAMLLDCSPQDIFEFCGHDGNTSVWHTEPYPYNLRGFHIQEIVEFAITRGYALIQLDVRPSHAPTMDVADVCYVPESKITERLKFYLDRYDCLLIMSGHACAWERETKLVYDPNGFTKSIDYKEIITIFPIIGIKSDS